MTTQHLSSVSVHPSTRFPWSSPIVEELAETENRLRAVPEGQHEMLTGAMEGLFGAGGKRIRPALALLTAGVLGVDMKHATFIAAAVELLHTATLVHDDLIDGASLRRGSPTLNAIWSPDIAVLVGDYLFSRSASLIARVNTVSVMNLFAKTLSIILNGEIMQRFSKWNIDRERYYQRIYAKTGALFVLPSQSVTLLGNVGETVVEAFVTFSRALGMAFQIVDDILDFVGETDRIGKPIGSDLRQGLFTLPAIYYAENHPQDPVLIRFIQSQNGSPELVQRVIDNIQTSGTIAHALNEAQRLVEAGKRALHIFPDSAYKESLFTLADHIVQRDF